MNWRNYLFGGMLFTVLGIGIAWANPEAQLYSDTANGIVFCAAVAMVLYILAIYAGTDDGDDFYL